MSPADPPPQHPPIVPRLLDAITEVVLRYHAGRRHAVNLDSDFERDLGLDSLARAEVLLRVGEAFGAPLPDAALSDGRTPRDLLAYLGHAGPAPAAQAETTLPPGEAAVPIHAKTLIEALEWHATRDPQRLHVLLYGEGGDTSRISYGALAGAAR
ncbi:MAG: acyl carrier protein, partial [Rhodocyclaceae bacterium]